MGVCDQNALVTCTTTMVWAMPVLSHHSMANLLVLDPSMGKIWPNEYFYGCPLTKATAIPLYYDYINHLDTLPLSAWLTA